MKKEEEKCYECGQAFTCSTNNQCWCMDYPHIFELGKEQCLCESCFKEALKKKIDDYLTDLTTKKIHKIQTLSSKKMIEGIDYTINGQGRYVFSKWYLIKKGPCCHNGCLNCPY